MPSAILFQFNSREVTTQIERKSNGRRQKRQIHKSQTIFLKVCNKKSEERKI